MALPDRPFAFKGQELSLRQVRTLSKWLGKPVFDDTSIDALVTMLAQVGNYTEDELLDVTVQELPGLLRVMQSGQEAEKAEAVPLPTSASSSDMVEATPV
jgi:uncharacterized phage-associated protein